MKRNSIASNWRVDARLALVLALAASIGVGYFLLVSALTYRIGFPLDDSWIHLVYARNFAEYGEWAFRLGERSAGSTAPLWTALLAIGFLLHLAPYAWTYFLGWVVLTAMAILAENVARQLIKSYQPRLPWVGLFFVFEWHLTWSATSGMETLLHGLIALAVLSALLGDTRRYTALGLLVGVSIWVRPDGLTLLGPVLFAAFFREDSWSSRARAFFGVLFGFAALFLPYLVFNLALSGTPMPNTFYAKQAEYEAYWLSKPLTERLTTYLLQIIASPLVVLIPGVILWIQKIIRERNWGALAGLLWFFGYIGIYFMRLPAYQHGRYIIPALPILYLWGLFGMLEYLVSPRANQRISFAWKSLVIVLCLAFQVIGARQNADDVIWIEGQMVQTAKWVNENLTPETVLAVHDIGAIGYFAQNPLIDLAGLITPEVVPFIRDQPRLAEYIDSTSAEYLIAFPSLYPELTAQRSSVFVGGIDEFPFDENMHVYQWK
jgi:hypothetical protein